MNVQNSGNPVNILLVEDNPGDVRLVKEAIRGNPRSIELAVARDGEEAVALLRQNVEEGPPCLPALILLDLNLPKKNGREVLTEIKKDPALKRIPVVVFSASQAETDIKTTYDLHTNCYIPKPIDLDQYLNTIWAILDFWLDLVKLPKG
jgi:CheY-like chemotaxis protein